MIEIREAAAEAATAARVGRQQSGSTPPMTRPMAEAGPTAPHEQGDRPEYPPGYSVRHALRSRTLACLAEAALARMTGEPPRSPGRPPVRLWSDTATWLDLLQVTAAHEAPEYEPLLGDDWAMTWTVTLGRPPAETTVPLADLTPARLLRARQARVFSFSKSIKARSGVQGMSSLTSDVPFETRMEQRALVALDFHGLRAARSQPFRLEWSAKDGTEHHHTPDYFVSTATGHTVLDVRLATIVGEHARRNAAALQIACAWLGWDYYLVTGLIQPGYAVIDALHGAAIADTRTRSEYGEEMLRQVRRAPGGVPVAALVNTSKAPAISRFALRHLLWHRQVAIDLNDGLYDTTPVFPARDAT